MAGQTDFNDLRRVNGQMPHCRVMEVAVDAVAHGVPKPCAHHCIFLCIPPVRSGNGRPSECFDAYAAQNDLRLSKEEIVISKIDYSITDLPEERLYEFQMRVLPKNANPAAGG